MKNLLTDALIRNGFSYDVIIPIINIVFNIDNLKWNKVIICTDADVDGFQIRTLVLTMIYRLMPALIDMGKVYIAESPLYEITTKDKTYFAYTECHQYRTILRLPCSV